MAEILRHSGFTSKQQETFYNKTLERLVYLMAQRLLLFYKPDEALGVHEETKWVKQLRKCEKALLFMERGKSCAPKFGETKPLT